MGVGAMLSEIDMMDLGTPLLLNKRPVHVSVVVCAFVLVVGRGGYHVSGIFFFFPQKLS